MAGQSANSCKKGQFLLCKEEINSISIKTSLTPLNVILFEKGEVVDLINDQQDKSRVRRFIKSAINLEQKIGLLKETITPAILYNERAVFRSSPVNGSNSTGYFFLPFIQEKQVIEIGKDAMKTNLNAYNNK